MRKLLILTVILIATGCTIFEGTDQGKEKITYDYTITNNSGVIIEIIPYDRAGNKDLSKKITLLNGKSLNKQAIFNKDTSERLTMPGLIYPSFLTKIEIVFNSTKKINYSDDCIYNNGVSTNCNTRNIFLLEYSDDKNEIYTITPEDYQNAVDCGGNCN